MKELFIFTILAWASIGIDASKVQSAGSVPVARLAASQAAVPPQSVPPAPTSSPQEYKALVVRYCVGCHNERSNTPAANPLRLDSVDFARPERDAVTFERVIQKLAVGAMPPQGMPRPDPGVLDRLSGYLVTSLDRAAAQNRNPGHYVVHRLNRFEYANAVHDLVDVDFDAAEMLPNDGGDFGFDNIATALGTSPMLLERYLAAAMKVSATAVGNAAAQPEAATFEISREHTQRAHVEGLPLGTRGGAVVRHTFPADGDYELSARLLRGIEEGYVGLEGWDTSNEFIITIDGEQVYSAPIGGTTDHAAHSADVNKVRLIVDGRMTTRAFVTAGPHDIGFTWRDKPHEEQAVWQPPLRDSQEVHMVVGWPRLRTMRIVGPYNVQGVSATASRQRIFVCRPTSSSAEAPCADRIFSSLARRAFRRPVSPADLEAPLAFYAEARRNGGDFDAGIRAGLTRILCSPSFLYRMERDPAALPPGAAHTVSDVELASRLSFFLWSSIPDDELLQLAERRQLHTPAVLAAQVRRMVADPRSDRFVISFAGQWLALRSIEARVSPDLLLFPNFDDNVRKAFRRETELFVRSVMREDRSLLELLTANYTFVDERLARHYGMTGVYGERFRRVEITDPHRRGLGLLGQGSLLAVTSVATRTSPTIRGKFILTTLMGLPAPVPPPNVPALDESAPQSGIPKTTRQRVESHRTNPVCASCHRTIDPLGFALENFDSTGVWREADSGGPIDVSGVMADGTKIDSPSAVRDWFLAHPTVFVGNVAERMLTYALGRGLEPQDRPVVRAVVRGAAQNDYRFMGIVMGIVESAPFQMRVKQPSAAGGARQASVAR